MSRGTSLALLALLLCAVIDSEQRRCFCSRKISYVSVRQIKTLEIIHPSVDCDQMQIMAVLKTGSKICLDPNARMVKKVLRLLARKYQIS
ncbi:platelet basic protein isoform X2 [Latimeria chalumnae]|uniref:platelet basic protein isoform X2 n=1 Tax=Latimeria chalumnae TaxID=7897 RepID=UPI0003C11DBF|nr:PREDICTED: platelet basic protein-like isoform X2 [Latimeria chalumnae]|eukprot:XP_006003785.1 PREDICTED: platelet basic protein-like isoform X2 [Latimeria chalumnae]